VIAGFIGFGFVCTQKYCSQNHIMNKELKWIMLNKIDIFIKIFLFICVLVVSSHYLHFINEAGDNEYFYTRIEDISVPLILTCELSTYISLFNYICLLA
jgi:hypothetical protein